jgi:hypothetical protein
MTGVVQPAGVAVALPDGDSDPPAAVGSDIR